MKALFELILFQPIFNAFVGLYNIIPDVGFVIITITLIIKLVLYPLTSKSLKAQKSLADLQPKLQDIKETHKGDQQTIAQETMKLYKNHKVNPFGSCLPLVVQIPILLALYWVLRAGLTHADFTFLYSFVKNPGTINTLAFGFLELSRVNIVLAALAGGAQFFQAKLMYQKRAPKEAGEGAKDENMMAMMNKQMLYFMPFFTFLIGLSLPAGLTLYWFISTAVTALQQL
ncbi:MAG: hypothetical protein COU30_00415, partial [Candidatus Magasanikbacteria bacterium CG10_big_fil_rev_8_21_14_0_10_38_6]